MRKRVYLAGPITGLSYNESTDWREFAKTFLAKYCLDGISPMRGKDFLRGEKILGNDYAHPLANPHGIVSRDHNDVLTCDLILANFLGAKEVSIGTMVEYGWARAYNKPIVCVMEKTGNPHDHCFVRELSGFVVEKLEDGLDIARIVLNP